MAYTRQPNSVLAGRALTQFPGPNPLAPAGVLPVKLDADIATTNSLGVVQVGTGLTITSAGILSATGGGTGVINVKLTAVDYLVVNTDYYIGAINKGITITLSLGVVGKVYYVKNQANGAVTVTGTAGQTLDASVTKNLGSEDALIVVFDGTRWNII